MFNKSKGVVKNNTNKHLNKVKIICTALAILFIGVGCGNQGPTDKVLKDELNANIKDEWLETHEITGIKVIESITNEKEYSAKILSTVEGTYAVFDIYADVEFIKYDQGWKLEECDWNDVTIKEFLENKFREDAKTEVETVGGILYEIDFVENDKNEIEIYIAYGCDIDSGRKIKYVMDRKYSVLQEKYREGYGEEYICDPKKGDEWILSDQYEIKYDGKRVRELESAIVRD